MLHTLVTKLKFWTLRGSFATRSTSADDLVLGCVLRMRRLRLCRARALGFAPSRSASRPCGDDPLRFNCAHRRGQSVPRPACGGAMLTLLRLPC
jgi:hypothetical protein